MEKSGKEQNFFEIIKIFKRLDGVYNNHFLKKFKIMLWSTDYAL